MLSKVQEAYEEFLASLRRRADIKERTFRNYKSFLDRFLKWTDRYNLNPLDVRAFVTYYFFEYYRRNAHEANKRGFAGTVQNFYTHAGMPVEISWRVLDQACQELEKKKQVPEDPVEFFHGYAQELAEVAVKPAEEEEEAPEPQSAQPEVREEVRREVKKVALSEKKTDGENVTVTVMLIQISGTSEDVLRGVEKITHDFFSSAPEKLGT